METTTTYHIADLKTIAMIGAGLATIGAGLGIGWIGGRACEAVSRQPEAYAKIQTLLLIAAGMIEGVALFAVLICFLKS